MKLEREVFQYALLLVLAMILFFGVLFSVLFYRSGIANASEMLKEHNRALSFFIEGYFIKLHNSVNFLASDPDVIYALDGHTVRKKAALRLYRALELSDPDINYIYSGYEDGSLLINHYTPPPGYDPRVRPWYRAAIEAAPKISNGIPYREIKTKEWLVSISKVLRDDQNRTTGVVAVDSSIEKITKLLAESVGSFCSSYSVIVSEEGTILVHPDSKYLGKKISELLGRKIAFPKHAKSKSYALEFPQKLLYYHRIAPLGWIVLTVAPRQELLLPIWEQILLSLALTILIAILLAWALSIRLGHHIVQPLRRLHETLKLVIAGQSNPKLMKGYPDNEIGTIAKEIEALTEKELYKRNRQLSRVNKRLEILSSRDRLTGLYNRRKMSEELKKEFLRSQRYGHPFSLLMLDIDYYKKINDRYGHQAGDAVLRELGRLMRQTLRRSDLLSRWGGEEFLILLPETSKEQARLLAEKLRQAVQKHRFIQGISVTVSIGVHELHSDESLDTAISKADAKLYEAKRGGRNRVVA